MKNVEYLYYCIPLIFFLLSRRYMLKYNRLRNTGKIPRIIDARIRKNLFLCLAILSVVLILMMTQFQLIP